MFEVVVVVGTVLGILVGRDACSIGGGVSIIAVGDATRVLDLTTNADDPTTRKAKIRLTMLFMM